MELHKIGVKFFAEDSAGVELTELIPIFHRWIKENTGGQVLVDVADYSHVYAGPGVLLVGHEGHYSFEEVGGRRGLAYSVKRASQGSLEQRLSTACRTVLEACERLAAETELGGRLEFGGAELEIFANDRLAAPNTEDTFAALRPSIEQLAAQLYPGAACDLERAADAKERFSVLVKAPEAISTATLLGRLAT